MTTNRRANPDKTSKRLYLVKREVLATGIIDAARQPGKIVEIYLAAKEFQPDDTKKVKGFQKKKQ